MVVAKLVLDFSKGGLLHIFVATAIIITLTNFWYTLFY